MHLLVEKKQGTVLNCPLSLFPFFKNTGCTVHHAMLEKSRQCIGAVRLRFQLLIKRRSLFDSAWQIAYRLQSHQ